VDKIESKKRYGLIGVWLGAACYSYNIGSSWIEKVLDALTAVSTKLDGISGAKTELYGYLLYYL
jgi:hypothetical protein